MSRRSLALVPMVAALILAAPAVADAQSVTATGSSQVKVLPADRQSNGSIASAVAAAQKQAVPGALSAAHANALLYAQGAGLTLGSVLSVSDALSPQGYFGPYGFPGGNIGPFGPGKYCGIVRRGVIKRTGGRVRVVHVKKIRRCIVPEYASSTLTVTYSAT
ncbi:MAG TPA: hypothetical protein VG295_12775 [Solirubrobacteraceae bacterium]|nr:hypothetical protein [Solirubrobacteraceae bacterium]